jgi:hypothetical protein
VLSTGAPSSASHIIFQRNKKICIVVVNSDEYISCRRTIRTIRSVTSTGMKCQNPHVLEGYYNLLAARSTILAVLSIPMPSRISAISSPPTRLTILASTARTAITTFRVQAKLFISRDLPQLTSVRAFTSHLKYSSLIIRICQSNADI